ncbi:MAG: histidine kinase dimerization/phospho-acceptor domain-containing protein [Faecalimonas sp.]|nr:histidine kinase dimerization/phospho-acceptor domain-containing protein [Faecalimonas sp.]
MDTKSKKSFKLKYVLIALCVLLPAVLLVSLYPKMEQEMLKKRAVYEEEWEQSRQEAMVEGTYLHQLDAYAINYAMEASYYIYGQLLDESSPEPVNFAVLQQYGWISDYHEFYENALFVASYEAKEGAGKYEMKNTVGYPEDSGIIRLRFDEYGNLIQAETERVHIQWEYADVDSIYDVAMRSEVQYRNNVEVYNEDYEPKVSVEQLRPKNFTIEFAVNEDSDFVHDISEESYNSWVYTSPEALYFETGAYWVLFIVLGLVGVLALLLPLVGPLKTGKEKLFMLPLELVFCGIFGLVAMVTGMGFAMAYSTMYELSTEIGTLPQILGYEIERETIYYSILILNVLGWALTFFVEYVMIACLRNLLLHPVQYVKQHTLLAGMVGWVKSCGVKLYRYVTDIEIHTKLHSSILKIVLVNLAILVLICCMWFFGIVGLFLYSIVLYIVMRKYGEKLQRQYRSILHATEQMAEGDLKISLDKDLGVFGPIGDSLEKVQQGFEKAVVEEAKSQSMKTELITNVSHDLKTPLTAIITYVNLLKKEELTEEERQRYIGVLDAKSKRLQILIEDLFEVSKAQSGNVKMNLLEVDVVSLLKQVRSEMDEGIAESGLQFRWKLPEEKILLTLDGQRMYRVFENLLGNILKYAMPQSRVYIEVSADETQVQLSFRNVSATELDFDVERLTERFVQGDVSRNTEGSGLGLAIAKSFVELQGGSFAVEVDEDIFKAIIKFKR